VFRCGGINHQAWFTEFREGDRDLYPEIKPYLAEKYIAQDTQDRGVWGGERVRTEIMNAFGYFHTESSPHASEYLPYFRKNEALIEHYVPMRWDFEDVKSKNAERQRDRTLVESLLAELKTSLEYGAWIVNAMESGTPTVIYGNVMNNGLIDNLSPDACVEVACLVDRNGIQPTRFGNLPPQCAAVNETNINVQRLVVLAALEGNREHVYHAVMLDPLTAAVCTLGEIRSMVDELFEANEGWLPALA
jgi:alpha-galactosidase